MKLSRAERERIRASVRSRDPYRHEDCLGWLEFALPYPGNHPFILQTLEALAARTKSPWFSGEPVDLLCELRRGPLTQTEKARLRRLAKRRGIGSARVVMLWLRAAEELEVSKRFCQELAEQLAQDPRREVRGPALRAATSSVARQPHRLWKVAERMAQSRHRRVLRWLAEDVVEHLLEDDCARYLPRIEARIEAGDRRWVRVLSHCYPLGQAVAEMGRIHSLLRAHSTAYERTRWVWGREGPRRNAYWADGLWWGIPAWPGDDRLDEPPGPMHAMARQWRGGQYGEAYRSAEGRRRLGRERAWNERRRWRPPMPNRVSAGDPDDYYRIRYSREEQDSLRELAAARDLKTRRRCIEWLECGAHVPANMGFISDLILELARDPRDGVRYRALLIMDWWSLYHPHVVWRLLQRLARERSAQLRQAAGVCGLEYFLAAHCDRYFPLIEREVRSGVRGWIRMLAACYILGKAVGSEDRIHALLDAHSTAEERTRWVWGKDGPPEGSLRWRDGHYVALRRPARRRRTPASRSASPTGARSSASTTSATGGTRGRAMTR